LYQGFEAECFVMGKLYGAGFEAFKLPADFGLDLLVTNQKEQSIGRKKLPIANRSVTMPYALQVKSRKIEPKSFSNSPNHRLEATTSIGLKVQDWELLVKESNTFLVAVLFFKETENVQQERAAFFWLHSSHLQFLDEKGYFWHEQKNDSAPEQLFLDVCLRLEPRVETQGLLTELFDAGQLSQEGREKLLRELPSFLPRTWQSSPYVALLRPNRSTKVGKVARRLPEELQRFEKLGQDIPLHQID
jgi:hypothetical protein